MRSGASLSDPDGGVTGEMWQWAKSSNGSTGWTNIQGATSGSYTPGESDAGIFLRATASYDDAVGTGKSAQAATSSGVAQMELLSEYDANRNESIERSEAIRAVSDYFDGEISKDDCAGGACSILLGLEQDKDRDRRIARRVTGPGGRFCWDSEIGSPSRARTCNLAVNSRSLYH